MNIRNCSPYLLLLVLLALSAQPAAPLPAIAWQQADAPTFRVFATREGLVGHVTANGHIIQPHDHFVALPSWKVLCSYQGSEYQVRITYKGRTTIAPVWDVGPWNTNDEYWTRERRFYTDLPVGVPMAQAAYMQGYNGGLDMYGRRISNPNGIDIADGTFWDALGMTRNDWVEVSFLWMGRDPGPGAAVQAPLPPYVAIPATPLPAIPLPPDIPDRQTTVTPAETATATPEPAPPAAALADPLIDDPLIDDPRAIVVDNDGAQFQSAPIFWKQSVCGVNGSHTWDYVRGDLRGSEARSAWRPELAPGRYEIRAYIPACGTVPATRQARYVVVHDGGVNVVTLDQEAAAGTWASLGSYAFLQRAAMVELSGLSTDDGERGVRFDALLWLPEQQSPAEDDTDSIIPHFLE